MKQITVEQPSDSRHIPGWSGDTRYTGAKLRFFINSFIGSDSSPFKPN